MTIDFAIDYIPRRMKELGFGSHYMIRLRHFVLQPKEKRQIKAPNQLFMLIDTNENIAVYSDFGVFDLTQEKINELQYEHRGSIRIRNYAGYIQHVRFIQVIPGKK
jgi:hypothetical protein